MLEDLIKDSGFYDYVLEEGKEQGIQQGIQQGQLELLRQMATEQVGHHFPDADAALFSRIEALTDRVVLRRIVMDIGSAPDLATIEAWIDAAQPDNQTSAEE